ncbi:GNAT family N-acetyltransferase [Solirubrobacter ginsenosidimutans]|uniref:GNAT family N-acetyltransferase n=1 Tax=Solirubrobacter ginsenosidimutans TaxID=490573 RepID=A0A9X3MZD8_9ACTN|nr:GNAT family N-acetyltransferase [Solirubrobacter ginsenosidimutans]MDA0164148.1 GNAT family N-acetyltransferase [Solirubrobacter ginsenosidimutans]
MRLRPATPADAQRAADLVIAGDIADVGVADYSLGDLEDEWRELDLDADTRLVEDDEGAIVGCAHFRGSDVLAQVDPNREGEGFGTALLTWSEKRASQRGATKVRQGVGDRGQSARALLQAHGYAKTRSFWRMERPATTDEAPADETGLRPVDPTDAPTLYDVTIRAFAHDTGYEIKPLDEWTRREFNGHGVDHTLSRTADGIGYALVRRWDEDTLYIPLLAVHPDHQGQGLGARLLRSVFAAARGRRVTLNVASDNPYAVRLYERVGMQAAWRVDDYQKALPN